MRFALFADIHGNLEAFQAVLGALREERIDSYICLGDIVGYGANPGECIELVKDLDCVTIAGNHDWAAVDRTSMDYFNPYAREAVLWTRNQLRQENQDFLKGLELIHRFDCFTIVHATLKAPEKWKYIFSISDALQSFQLLSNPILFVGHSHVPVVFEENGGYRYYFSQEVDLEEGRKYIINIGSVGQPRDRDPRATFCLYDTESHQVKIRRVEYNVEEAMRKIVEANLPPVLAWRLKDGE
ncbi:metallophosphoesterase family protein [bacterium]|nr:metallophosphoesterase family protein [bacterium]